MSALVFSAWPSMSTSAQNATPTPTAADITRTQWEINLGGDKVDIPVTDRVNMISRLGHGELYKHMNIPPLDAPGWQTPSAYTGTVPFRLDGNAITFGGPNKSILTGQPNECFIKADFTYFKTEVTIPQDATVTKFEVTFQKVDDGARAYVFNTKHPNGAFDPEGDIRLQSPNPRTSNLASYVVPGETNTVVIVQVDNCPSGNNLLNAQIKFEGAVAGKEIDKQVPVAEAPRTPQIRYVDHDAVGRATGETWADAFLTVGDALQAAQSGDQIWVAEGIYYPDQIGKDGDKTQVEDSNDSTQSYHVPSGVHLYGGFVGTEADLAERNWEQYVTVLSGDIEQDDELKDGNGVVTDAGGIRGNNSHHIIYLDGNATQITNTTIIDGFMVTGGAAHSGSASQQPDGGGLYCRSGGNGGQCSPLLEDLIFSGNSADSRGGAIFNDGANGGVSSPYLEFVTFTGNAANDGGAMFNDGNGGTSSPAIENATFTCNTAKQNGGAMYNDGSNSGVSSPALTNVTFDCNSAQNGGGAMLNFGANGGVSSPTLAGVDFICNTASLGGAMYNHGGGSGGAGSPSLIDVTFKRNTAHENVGAMMNDAVDGGASSPTLIRVNFVGNTTEGSAGALGNQAGTNSVSSPTLTEVVFSGNHAKINGGAVVNDAHGGTVSPTFTNITFSGNSALADGGAISNMTSDGGTLSPTVVNAVFSGNQAGGNGGATANHNNGSGGPLTPALTNVTFSGNSAIGQGGAIYTIAQSGEISAPVISNSILWGNAAAEGASIYYDNNGTATISHSLVENGASSIVGGGSTQVTGASVAYDATNIDSDPRFAHPVDPATAPTTRGSLRLQADSPAINVGDNAADLDAGGPGTTTISGIATDLAGNARIMDNTVDLGAYEFQGSAAQIEPTIVRGRVEDATNNQPLAGAQVCVANTNLCVMTDNGGRYEVPDPAASAQQFTVSLTGYISLTETVTPVANKTLEQDFALSPVLSASKIRIVLTWGAQPKDLDAYLWVPGSTETFLVRHDNKGRNDAFPYATLDLDDQFASTVDTGGPETVTIEQLQNGVYTFAVHNYSKEYGSSGFSFSDSQAHVQVYRGDKQIADYTPKEGSDGIWWIVFRMEGSESTLTEVNLLQNEAPTP